MFDDRGYAWFARIAGALFVVLQQVILLDVAYTINDMWLEAERLVQLLVASIFLLASSLTVIGLLFWQFSGPGCSNNEAILSITLILVVAVTIFQVFVSEEGNLLVSAFMAAYATYLAYSAVALNPDLDCNPTISTSYQTISEVIGIIITVTSLTWTAYSTS